jgi:hypothetical protein
MLRFAFLNYSVLVISLTLFESSACVRANEHAAISELLDRYRKVSAAVERTSTGDGIKFSQYYIYVTKQKAQVCYFWTVDKGRIQLIESLQMAWTDGVDGYVSNWVKSPRSDWEIKSVSLWPSRMFDARQPYRRLDDSILGMTGLWGEWSSLPQDLPEYILSHPASFVVSHNNQLTQFECSSEWGKITVSADLSKRRLHEIIHEKGPKSLYSRDIPKPLYEVAPKQRSRRNELRFVYNSERLQKIENRLTLDNDGVIASGLDTLVFKELDFGTDDRPPRNFAAPHIRPIPEGMEIRTAIESLRTIALEWRNGQVVKAVDKTALDIIEKKVTTPHSTTHTFPTSRVLLIVGLIAVILSTIVIVRWRRVKR